LKVFSYKPNSRRKRFLWQKEEDMKKLVCIIITLAALLGSFAAVFAEEQKAPSSLVMMAIPRIDFVMPQKGDSTEVYRFFGYGLYNNTFGLGADVASIPERDYSEVKPIATLNSGPHFVVTGLKITTADKENKYLQAGYWFFKSNAEYRLLVDIRNYFDIGGDKSSYLDSCVEYVKWFGKIGVGPTATFDYWWHKDRNLFDVGPIAYYALSKDPFIAPFVRYQHEWKRWGGISSQTDYLRFGVYVSLKKFLN
jgi:hypothetical protein